MLVVVLAAASYSVAARKELPPAPPDRAVVYIGKLNAFVGAAWPFHVFADEQYLARVKGKNYVRHECEPGTHVFWVAAQARRTFVKAELEAGRSYALYAKLTAGAELIPITRGSKDWKEFFGLIRGKKPLGRDEEYLAKWSANQPGYIATALAEWRAAGEPALRLMKDEYIDE
ncbi:MAG: hypothetical protein IT480_15195 [Gammaproteobacteria bacterium]|nr:hypothetical protein [Gammaproteobacteria bacterium]